jgi:hypothetical protein
VFVLGAPCAGKTTVAHLLRDTLAVPILDTDDEVVRRNGGVWPDIETKNDVFVPQVLDLASSLDDVLLLNSYALLHWTERLRRDGFTVVLLDLSEAEQARRDERRLAEDGWTNREWFAWHRAVIDDHRKARLIDDIVDGGQPIEQVAAELAALVLPPRSSRGPGRSST